MGQFVPGKDTTVSFDGDPILQVLVDKTNSMSVGKHVFQLTVTDDSSNLSDPATVTVIVLDREKPTAVIDVMDAQGVPAKDNTINFGQQFILSGKRSSDVGGQVKTWAWSLLPS